MTHFAERAESIRREMLAVDLDRAPRVALVVYIEDDAGQRHAHREPITLSVPDFGQFQPLSGGADPSLAFKQIQASDSPAQRARMRRGMAQGILRSAAELVARAVTNLPAAAQGARMVDARLEVIYP